MDNEGSARDRGGARDEPGADDRALDVNPDEAGTAVEYPERHEPEFAPGSEAPDDSSPPQEPDPEVKDPDLLPERDFSTDESGKLR